MKEDISRVLKMMEEGKIDADKATELISAIKEKESEKDFTSTLNLNKTGNLDKMLKIKVNSAKGDNVDVKLPIKFVKAILNATGKIPGLNINGGQGIDIEMISEAIESGIDGKIVDVKSANGDTVEVVIE